MSSHERNAMEAEAISTKEKKTRAAKRPPGALLAARINDLPIAQFKPFVDGLDPLVVAQLKTLLAQVKP